jgi:hypothetical protein
LISDEELDDLIEKLLRNIFRHQGISKVPDAMFDYFTDQLTTALIEGYGSSLDDFDADTPDYNMLEALQADVVKFAAAKSDVMNMAIAKELIGPDGKLREYKDFRIAAMQITGDHTDAWLKAEYNLAVVQGYSAAKWVTIEEDAEDLPILEFSAIIDGRTTEICRNFDGIRLPWDHVFWDMYYIPNHYGERSIIKQTQDSGEITDYSTIITPDRIPEIFKVNLAKLKLAFPPGHPYYLGKHG